MFFLYWGEENLLLGSKLHFGKPKKQCLSKIEEMYYKKISDIEYKLEVFWVQSKEEGHGNPLGSFPH